MLTKFRLGLAAAALSALPSLAQARECGFAYELSPLSDSQKTESAANARLLARYVVEKCNRPEIFRYMNDHDDLGQTVNVLLVDGNCNYNISVIIPNREFRTIPSEGGGYEPQHPDALSISLAPLPICSDEKAGSAGDKNIDGTENTGNKEWYERVVNRLIQIYEKD